MAKKMMTDGEVETEIASQIEDAISWSNTTLARDRNDAMKSYHGEGYEGDDKLPTNHSRVVTQDVLETVEWMLPSLLRIFTSGDKAVTFNAQGPEDEAMAAQESDAVNYVWNQQNNGFMNFFTAFKDALLQKAGVFLVEWNEGSERAIERYEGLTLAELTQLQNDPDLSVEKVEPEENDEDELRGEEPMNVEMTFKAEVRPKSKGKISVEVVPPEDFLLARNSRSVETATFKAWRREMTISEARSLGYDVPDDIGRSNLEAGYEMERQQRFKDEGGTTPTAVPATPAARLVWVVVSYMRLDVDGDGISELRRIVTIEKKLYENEEVADDPFADLCPVPMPHKAIGLSVADLVMDLQLIKSTLVRQMLNNLYATNHPRIAVQSDGIASIDELLDYRTGGIVRTLGPPGNVLMPLTVPFVAKEVLPVLAMFEEMKASRSGVTKYNQGLDANTLNPTATGIDKVMNAAMARIEMIARIFAETGIRRAFLKVHALLRQHADVGRSIPMKLGGRWVQVAPRSWRERTDMTASVGLGTGDKSQLLASLMNLAAIQEKLIAMQQGLAGPFVKPANVYALLESIVENAGLRSPEKYFTNPIDPATGQPTPTPPPPPDPTQMATQAALQIEQQKAATAKWKAEQDVQLSVWKAQQEADLARWKAEQEFALRGLKVERDAQVKATSAAVSQQQGVVPA